MKLSKNGIQVFLQKIKDLVNRLQLKIKDLLKANKLKNDDRIEKPKQSQNVVKDFLLTNRNFIMLGLIFIIMIFAIVLLSSKPKSNGKVAESGEVITVKESAEGEESSLAANSNELQVNAIPQVNELVQKYYKALAASDMDTLHQIVDKLTDDEQNQIKQKREYIENYNNITCYTKKGPENNSYVVFVYYEIKFVNINTSVPGLTPLYICTNEDGKLYIYNGELDPEVGSYITNLASGDDVKELLRKVDVKYKEAQSNDPELKAFVDKLTNTNSSSGQ